MKPNLNELRYRAQLHKDSSSMIINPSELLELIDRCEAYEKALDIIERIHCDKKNCKHTIAREALARFK